MVQAKPDIVTNNNIVGRHLALISRSVDLVWSIVFNPLVEQFCWVGPLLMMGGSANLVHIEIGKNQMGKLTGLYEAQLVGR